MGMGPCFFQGEPGLWPRRPMPDSDKCHFGNMGLYIWVNYNELTTSSLEIMVSKGNHPQMALIQISELL